jgi:environmental stress-induced protein Ves
MQITLLRESDYQRTPWKNGLGFTDQIAIHPVTADLRRGDFLWRLSSARIERDAPFSPFPKHDRVLVVLDGAGVRLSHTYEPGEEADTVDLPPLEPYEFPGDVPTRCELVDGPIRDLSVFLAKGRVSVLADRVQLEAGQAQDRLVEGNVCFAFVARGEIRVGGHSATQGESLRIDFTANDAQPEVALQAGSDDAELILIQISSA